MLTPEGHFRRCIACLALAFVLAVPALADEAARTTIQVVFGADAIDITDQVDWEDSHVGIVESEFTNRVTDEVTSYNYSRRFEGDANTFTGLSGDIGLKLELPGAVLLRRLTVEPGTSEVVVDTGDWARIVFVSDDLPDDEKVGYSVSDGQSMDGGSSWWRDLQGSYYVAPGEYEVTLNAPDRNMSQTQEVSLSAGEEVTLTFDFAK